MPALKCVIKPAAARVANSLSFTRVRSLLTAVPLAQAVIPARSSWINPQCSLSVCSTPGAAPSPSPIPPRTFSQPSTPSIRVPQASTSLALAAPSPFPVHQQLPRRRNPVFLTPLFSTPSTPNGSTKRNFSLTTPLLESVSAQVRTIPLSPSCLFILNKAALSATFQIASTASALNSSAPKRFRRTAGTNLRAGPAVQIEYQTGSPGTWKHGGYPVLGF